MWLNFRYKYSTKIEQKWFPEHLRAEQVNKTTPKLVQRKSQGTRTQPLYGKKPNAHNIFSYGSVPTLHFTHAESSPSSEWMKTTKNKLQQHIIFQVKTDWLFSKQADCLQKSDNIKTAKNKSQQQRNPQFKTEWMLSTSDNIKTNTGQITSTQDFSIQNRVANFNIRRY